jgi:TonB family protein
MPKTFANSEPTIYSNDKSYWIPQAQIRPAYPSDALRESITGCMRVEFTINSEGKSTGHYEVISIPEKMFDKVALKAVKKASFIPSSTNVDKFPVRSSVVYAFNLHAREKPEYFSTEQCEKLTAR